MIENIIECMGCGASLSSEIKFCEYCQRLNPLYKETKLEYDNSTNSNKSIDTEITQESKIIIQKDTSKFSVNWDTKSGQSLIYYNTSRFLGCFSI